jgi:hypothetical protein
MQAPVSRRASGLEALTDGFNRRPGFWLRDGGSAPEGRSLIQAGCRAWPHNRMGGDKIGDS